jgi:tetratricopeptide (TPR) repeat protein
MVSSMPFRLLLFPGVFAILGVSLLPGRAQQADTEVQKHFLAAQQDQQQGRLDAAAQEYQTVLRLQPGLPEAYANLGLVYYAQSKFDESARTLAAAGKLRPGMRGISLWLGIDYVRLNRPLQAVALLREAVRLDPTDKLAQSWLGTALWNAGKIDAALLQLRATDARFPNDPDFVFALGEAYGKAASQQTEQLLEESTGTALSDLIYGDIYAGERDWTKAEGHLRRAIERDPHLLQARLDLAAVLLEQVHLPAAQEQIEQALLVAPRSAAALARSGELLILLQHPAEGLSRIEKAIEIDRSEALDALGLPAEDRIGGAAVSGELLALCGEATRTVEADATSSPAKPVALAALYSLAGDADAALRYNQRIAPARSSQSSTVNLLAQAMTKLRLHRYDDAEPLLVRWIAAHPEDRAARYQLVLARRQISQAQIARLLAIAPDSYHVHQLLGQMYVSLTIANEASDGLQQDDKAIAEYFAVAAARPDLPGVHFWLGHLYWKHGETDHAFTEFTRELELDPGHSEANGELGAVLVAQERAVEAIPHLESAIRSKPDLWPAYAQLGRAYAMQKDYVRAEQMLRHALAHDQDASAHYQLALVLRAEGKTAQAAQVFDEVRAIKSEKMAKPFSEDKSGQGAKQ